MKTAAGGWSRERWLRHGPKTTADVGVAADGDGDEHLLHLHLPSDSGAAVGEAEVERAAGHRGLKLRLSTKMADDPDRWMPSPFKGLDPTVAGCNGRLQALRQPLLRPSGAASSAPCKSKKKKRTRCRDDEQSEVGNWVADFSSLEVGTRVADFSLLEVGNRCRLQFFKCKKYIL